MQRHVPEAYMPLWTDNYEHYGYHGGRGGAKSHCIAEPVVAHSCQREERVVCGRQYQNSIKDSVKELLEKKIFDMGMSVYFKVTDRELENVSTGSRFTFIGMDRNPESAKSLEGATMFWGDEAQTFTNRSVEIIVPTVRKKGSRMIWSWNPRFRTDAVDAMFRGKVEDRPENSYVHEVSWRDNPFFFQTRMPSEFRRSKRVKPKRHVHIWEGGYDEDPEVIIYTDWQVGIMPITGDQMPLYGMDFGFSNDPNAIIKLYIFEELNIIYIEEEAFGLRVPNKQLAALLDSVNGTRQWPIVADSARPETIDYLNSEGFSVRGARKGPGSVKNGINFLQGYTIVVNPACTQIQEELRNYRWKTDLEDKPLPIPVDKFNHGLDAVRYAVEDYDTHSNYDDGVTFI